MQAAIEIENLSKEYRLGLIGYGTLKEDLQSWWAKLRGKEDPNSILYSGSQSDHKRKTVHLLALNNINLTVGHGERLGIIGPNGAGKTTLLKILSQITSPTKGTARLKGRVASLIAVGTGFHGELTGRENIYLNGAILGLRKYEIDQRIDEIIDFSGVEQFIDTPIKRYSSGMTIRLGFAVAAHLDPDVLIVDEVLAVGDVEFQKKAVGKMKDINKSEGRTILFVSHNMQLITSLCENAILLDKGEIVFKGDSKMVVDKYLKVSTSDSVNELLSSKKFIRDRRVLGHVKFTKFQLLNEQGKPSDSFRKGENVVYNFEYEVIQSINRLNFVAVLHNTINTPVAAFKHQISNNKMEAGYKGKIRFTIDTNSIVYGELLLNCYLKGKLKHEDYDFLSMKNLPPLKIVNTTPGVLMTNVDLVLDIKHSIESN